MTEDERDWCIGLQRQAQTWWARAQHHLKMSDTAKNWDTEAYSRIHAAVDQQYAAQAYAKALQILCADDLGQRPVDLLDTSSARPAKADAVRAAEILMGIGGQPDQAEKNKLTLKLARSRGAP